MPRVAITPTQASRAGTVLPTATTGDATNNHSVANDGNVALIIKNTNGASTARTVTFYTSVSVDGLTVPTRVESIPAGETQVFGTFPTSMYGETLNVDVSHAEITISAIRIA